MTISKLTLKSSADEPVRRVWMPPVLQGDFLTDLGSLALLSVVCQASGRGLCHGAGKQFEEQGPHRFREL